VDLFGLNMPVLKMLEQGLDNTGLRGKILQNNVANSDTPGFKRSDLNFEAALSLAMGGSTGQLPMRGTHPGHLPGVTFDGSNLVYLDRSTTTRNDGNNVDMDVEQTKIAENTYTYMYLARALTAQMSMVRQAYSTQ